MELLEVDVLGGALHQNLNASLDNRNGCEHNDNREQVRADWVSIPPRRNVVDDNGRDDDTHRHKHVAHHVQVSSIDVHVASVYEVAALLFAVAVAVTVVVGTVAVAALATLVLVLVFVLMVVVMVVVVIVVMLVAAAHKGFLDRLVVDG